MYKVIKAFHDLKDFKKDKNGKITEYHYYNAGDTYPRTGIKPTDARIEELSSSANQQGEPVIQEVSDEKEDPAQ